LKKRSTKSSKSSPRQNDARVKLALDLFDQKRYKESLELFLSLARRSKRGKDWMNVATTRAFMGDAAGAEEAMEKAIALQIKQLKNTPELKGAPLVHILTPAYMIYYMIRSLCAGGNAKSAIPWLNRLRPYYENRPVDDHLHITGGLPVFSQVVEAIGAVSDGAGPAFNAKEWIRSFQKSLDENGRAALDDFLKEKSV
jgi:hypothetical protein